MLKFVVRFVIGVLAAAVATVMLVGGVVGFRLAQGPVSLGFLTPYVQQTLAELVGVEVTIGDARLAWSGWQRTVALRALDVVLRPAGDRPPTVLPQVDLGLSLAAMLDGQIAPTSFDLTGLNVRVVRLSDGSLDIGLWRNPEAKSFDLSALVRDLERPDREVGIFRYLRRISILDGDFEIEDKLTSTTWRARDADMVLWREGAGVRGDLSLNLILGDRELPIIATGRFDPGGGASEFHLDFADVEPALLATAGGGLPDWLPALQLPFTGSLDIAVAPDGSLRNVAFDLTSDGGRFERPDLFAQPLGVTRLKAVGRYTAEGGRLELDEGDLVLGDSHVELAGEATFVEGAIGADLDVTADKLTVADLIRLWPVPVAATAKSWVEDRLHGGVIENISGRIAVTPEAFRAATLPAEAMDLKFGIRDGDVTFYTRMTDLTGAQGQGRLTGRDLELRIDRGRIGEVALSEGVMTIAGIHEPRSPSKIRFVLTGPVKPIADEINRAPLGLLDKIGLDAARIGGQAAARIELGLPLGEGLGADEISVAAAVNFTDLALPDAFGTLALSDGNLQLTVNRTELRAEGTVALNDVPMRIALHRAFGPQAADLGRVSLAGVLDGAQRDRLGLAAGDALAGPISFQADVTLLAAGDVAGQVRANLQEAALQVPWLDWRKAKGVPASLTFDTRTRPDGGLTIADLRFQGGGAEVQGKVDFGPGRKFRAADLDRLAVAGNDLALTIEADGGQGWIVRADGPRLDATAAFREWMSTGDSPPLGFPLRLQGRFDQVLIGPGQVLDGVSLTGANDGTIWRRFAVDAALAEGAAVTFRLVPGISGRALQLRSDDAGAVGRLTGFYETMRGGKLLVEAVIADDQPGAPISGTIRIKEFVVKHAPVLARVLTIGSLSGLRDTLAGDGIRFVQAEIPFTSVDGVMRLVKARATGPALGITADGIFDRAQGKVHFAGAIIPAYTLNSVLGNIPILGKILVGREGEGIFGMTYNVRGPLDKPKVSVNPLSALAPGILRNMFLDPVAQPKKDATPTPENESR